MGVLPEIACKALSCFKGIKRRMELVDEIEDVKIYDDFAHHPTAISTTLAGLRAKLGKSAVIRVVIEPRSNTMKSGIHQNQLIDSTREASEVIWFKSDDIQWSLESMAKNSKVPTHIMNTTEAIVEYLAAVAHSGDHVLIMSNGGFESIHARIATALRERNERA